MAVARLAPSASKWLCLSTALLASSCSGPVSSGKGNAPPQQKARAKLGPDQIESSLGTISITPLNHGSLWVSVGRRSILIDPTTKAMGYSARRADIILVTDVHSDHLDAEAIAQATATHTQLIWPQAVDDALGDKKPKHGTVQVLANAATANVGEISITAVPMYNHTRGPARGGLFHEPGRGNGYLLDIGDKRIYVSGDTACTPEMKALTGVDIAIVCMNLPFTMPPKEAAECVAAFKPKIVYPYHYRGSNLGEFEKRLSDSTDIEIRIRDWYPGEP